jgi:hypothetical protein
MVEAADRMHKAMREAMRIADAGMGESQSRSCQ